MGHRRVPPRFVRLPAMLSVVALTFDKAQTGGAVNTGGSANAVAVDVTTLATSVGGVLVVPGVSGTLSSSTAPTLTYGTNSGSTATVAIVPVASTSAVSSSSTRAPDGTNAQAQAAGLAVSLLGLSVVSANTVSSSARCSTVGTGSVPPTFAQVVGLSVLGQTVDLGAGSVTRSTPVTLAVPGVSDATLSVTVSQPNSTSSSTASVTALHVTAHLTVHGLALPTVDTDVLTLDVARSVCSVPAAVAPTISSLNIVSGLVGGGTSVTITGTELITGATTVSFGGAPAMVAS